LHKVLVPPRGLFTFGKFDQYKRDIPYSTLAQGFQNLIRPIEPSEERTRELRFHSKSVQEIIKPSG
jgi:predicted ATPase